MSDPQAAKAAKDEATKAHQATIEKVAQAVADAMIAEHFRVLLYSTSPSDIGAWIGVRTDDTLMIEHEQHDEIISELSDFYALVSQYWVGEALDPAKVGAGFQKVSVLKPRRSSSAAEPPAKLDVDDFLGSNDKGLREHAVIDIEHRMETLAEHMRAWGFEDYARLIAEKKDKLGEDRQKVRAAIETAIESLNASALENQKKMDEAGVVDDGSGGTGGSSPAPETQPDTSADPTTSDGTGTTTDQQPDTTDQPSESSEQPPEAQEPEATQPGNDDSSGEPQGDRVAPPAPSTQRIAPDLPPDVRETVDDYTVQLGDTLWTIAQTRNVSANRLKELNPHLERHPDFPNEEPFRWIYASETVYVPKP